MATEEASSGGDAGTAEAITDFLRRMRSGVEDGLDPASAAERAANDLPRRLRVSLETAARRLRGEYQEDEWGFDEGFA